MDKTSIKRDLGKNKDYKLIGFCVLVVVICLVEFCNNISTVAAKPLYLIVFMTFASVFYLNHFVENIILCLTFEITFIFLGYTMKKYLEYLIQPASVSEQRYMFVVNMVMVLVTYLVVEFILSNILDYKNYVFTNFEFVILFGFCATGFIMAMFEIGALVYYISALCVVAMLIGSALIKIVRQKEEKESFLVEKNRFLEKQNKLIRDKEEAKYRSYQKSADVDAKVRQKNHDLMYHFDRLLAFEGLPPEARIYINNLKTSAESSYNNFCTGSSILDLILEEKLKLAEKQKIKFKVIGDFSDGLFLQPTSISIIFENLINNAIEASAKVQDDEYKVINVVFYQEPGKEIYIKISNTAITDHLKLNNNGLIEIINNDECFHGITLGSVKAEVKKYNGDIKITIENNLVIIEVFIPVIA